MRFSPISRCINTAHLVAGRPVDGDTLRAGLSLMIGKIVLNNVVVLADILLDHVTESMSDAARDLSR